jgi:ssDNA-binding Zn-finger/Zn-ribbon topoisomerase 1
MSEFYGPGFCPECGEETVLRNGKNGEFYRCVNFPECCGTRDKIKVEFSYNRQMQYEGRAAYESMMEDNALNYSDVY